jgi:hypothetical protein
MTSVLALLLLASMAAVAVGLVRPGLVVRWGNVRTRRRALAVYGGACVLLLVLFGVVSPSPAPDGPTAVTGAAPGDGTPVGPTKEGASVAAEDDTPDAEAALQADLIRQRQEREERFLAMERAVKDAQAERMEASIVKVTALSLTAEYNANAIAADLKYKGKVVRVTGRARDIGRDLLQQPYVVLQGSNEYLGGVQCFFTASDEVTLARMSKAATYTIQGTCSGTILGNVLLKDCSVR